MFYLLRTVENLCRNYTTNNYLEHPVAMFMVLPSGPQTKRRVVGAVQANVGHKVTFLTLP